MGADIAIKVAGIRLRTPVIVAAGPLTHSVQAVQRLAAHAGVGGIVLKTVYSKDADTPHPYMAKVRGGLINYDWSATGVDYWSDERMRQLVETGLPLIASIYDDDEDTLVQIAQTMERRGAAMIEFPAAKMAASRLEHLARRIKASTRVPLAVKIGSAEYDLQASVRAIEAAGADAITCINTIGPCLAIDTETGRPLLGNTRGHGYLSGSALKPLSLRVVADVVAMTSLPVFGVGGIESAEDAIQMVMVGAHAVQVHTAAILKGPRVLDRIAEGIREYLEQKGLPALGSIRGASQQYLKAEPTWDRFVPILREELCTHCGQCERVCVYMAVRMEQDLPRFDPESCHSCGLCITACPPGALTASQE